MAVRTQKRRVREPFPVPAPMNSGMYKKIAYSFVGVTVLIVGVALWFSSVRATVTVSTKREPTTVNIDIDLAKTPKDGELQARVVQGVFEKTNAYRTTGGEGKVVIGTARGDVRISNTSSKAQPLVKTTRLLTADGRLFRIDDNVNVPAGGSVEVGAYATEDGGRFDIPADTAFTIPGLSESLQKIITAKSVSAFEGGSRTVRAVSAEDLAKAEEAIREAALTEAKAALAKEVNDPKLKDATYIVNTTEKNAGARVGEEVDEFLISAKVNVTGVFYAKSELDALVRERVGGRVPEGRNIAMFADAQMKTTYEISSTDVANERARVVARADVLTKPMTADNLVSKEAIAGLSIDEAESKIRNMAGIESVEITIRPDWVKRLPTLKDHISIKVK